MRILRFVAFVAVAFITLPAHARGTEVEIPVDFAIGPSAQFMFGPVMNDQLVHTALKIDLFAVIDQDVIRKNASRIPPKYRGMASKIKEARLDRPGPAKLIPDSLIISPKYKNTGIFGVTWKPIGFGVMAGEGAAHLKLDLGLVLTYMYLYSDVLPTTHFIRPGLEPKLELELMATKSFGFSIGWASAFYIPQELGGFGMAPIDQAIWHVGQAYVLFHFRFPYKTTI